MKQPAAPFPRSRGRRRRRASATFFVLFVPTRPECVCYFQVPLLESLNILRLEQIFTYYSSRKTLIQVFRTCPLSYITVGLRAGENAV